MELSNTFSLFIDWLKGLWESVNIKVWAESVGGTSAEAVQAAIHFGVGFAVGFLFKKYFKFVFFSLLATVLIILFLEYNKVLEINWQSLNVLLGFEPTADIGGILNATFDWIKDNLLIFVSSLVGFLIGYKLG
ncbi:hypothetical protein KAT08_03190 [Candidatus Babeliales bacterium]|nr:hypothetical protein [Candidatus Babeliales bacterium]